MKRAVLRRKHRVRKKLTYMYLKLNRSTKMKDSNDAQTIDWVDAANADTLVIAPPVNPALYAALNTIINRTINDLLTNQTEQQP